MNDHYKILGISRNSTPLEIKKAYRKLVMEHHPDKQTKANNEDTIKNINAAYDVLSDPHKRQNYDQSTGHGQISQQHDDIINDILRNNNFTIRRTHANTSTSVQKVISIQNNKRITKTITKTKTQDGRIHIQEKTSIENLS